MRPGLLTRLCMALLAAALLTYALFFAANILRLVHGITWDSDAVSTMVIAGSLGGHGGIYLSNHGQYNYLAIDAATSWLPGHRSLWEWWPVLVYVLSAALSAFVVRQVATPVVAAVTFVGNIAVGAHLLYAWTAQAFHGLTYANTTLLLAFAVLVCSFPSVRSDRRGRLVIATGAVLGLITGLDVASDSLLLVSGVVPCVFTVSVLVASRRGERLRRALPLATLVVCAIAAAIVTVAAGNALHISYTPLPVHATLARFQQNIGILGASFAFMVGSVFPRDASSFAVAGVASLLLLLAACAIMLLSALRSRARSAAPRTAVLIFCSTAVVALLVAFLFTDAAVDATAFRYLVPAYLLAITGLAATLAPWRAATAAACVGVSALAVAAALSLPAVSWRPSITAHLEAVIARAEQLGIHRGYADYWQGNPATWNTNNGLQVRAVVEGSNCGSADPGAVCPLLYDSAGSWYTPQAGASFLLTDTGGLVFYPPSQSLFGTPRLVLQIDQYRLYVYSYDIATRMLRGTH